MTKNQHISKQYQKKTEKIANLDCTQLIKEDYFTVYHWNLDGEVSTPLTVDYLLVSVIDGEGEIIVNGQVFPVIKGAHFIIPATVEEYKITGKIELVVAHESI